jgi:uncharacterized membrane protein YczE
MRDFILDIAVPTVAYFISVVICVGVIIFAIGLAVDLISNPNGTAWEDAQ